MATRELRTLLDGGNFFEGPRWRDGRWWVSDFYSHQVATVTPDGVRETMFEVAGQPSGLGWLPGGDLLVVSMTDHLVLRRTADGTVTTHADLGGYIGGHLNDMVVDAAGHAYVGGFGFDLMHGADAAATVLCLVRPDGQVSVAAGDLYFPNGSVVTPDGGTLIVGETMGGAYTAFTIGADGALSDRRLWAELTPRPTLGPLSHTLPQVTFGPDGCCLDAAGAIWTADSMGGRCVRVAEGGAILDEIAGPPGLGVYACMLGGPDRRTLLMCCAPDFNAAKRSAATEAVLVTTPVDVPGAGLP